MRKYVLAAVVGCFVLPLTLVSFPIEADAKTGPMIEVPEPVEPTVWGYLGQSKDKKITFEAKHQSGAFGQTKEDEPIVIMDGRIQSDTEVAFVRWYVRTVECKLGSGRLVTTYPSGKVIYDMPFVLRGPNLVDFIAEVLCSMDEAYGKADLPSSMAGITDI